MSFRVAERCILKIARYHGGSLIVSLTLHGIMYIRQSMHIHDAAIPSWMDTLLSSGVRWYRQLDCKKSVFNVDIIRMAMHSFSLYSPTICQPIFTYLLSKEPAHSLQHTILLRVVRVVLGRDLKQRGESGRVRLDAVSYLLGDLAARQQPPSPVFSLAQPVQQRTCWLISRIAMSLRSEVKRSKAASMALFSVLASTTRKFFCASGGWVTCCALCQSSTPLPPAVLQWTGRGLTPTPASSMPVTVS